MLLVLMFSIFHRNHSLTVSLFRNQFVPVGFVGGVLALLSLRCDLLLPLLDKLVSRLLPIPHTLNPPLFMNPNTSGRSRSKGSLALELLRPSSSKNEGYVEVVGRVGPGEEPRVSGPKSKDTALERRCESEKGDSVERIEARELSLLREEMTVERYGLVSESARNDDMPLSILGDMADTKPESIVLELLGWCCNVRSIACCCCESLVDVTLRVRECRL